MTEIPKDQIMEMLTARGEGGQIPEAANQLPDPVDSEKHADLLKDLGVDPADFQDGGEGGLKFGIDP